MSGPIALVSHCTWQYTTRLEGGVDVLHGRHSVVQFVAKSVLALVMDTMMLMVSGGVV